MNTRIIFEYYGIACAVLLPVCLMLVIVFARKGGLIEKVNGWLDAMMPAKKTASETDKKKTEEKKETDWDRNSKVMTCMRLKAGETYQCILSDTEKNEVGSQREWSVSDAFVGQIDDDTAVFKALKAGKTYVECGEVRIYYIEVTPKDGKWFARQEYEAYIQSSASDQIKKMYPPKKIQTSADNQIIKVNDILQNASVTFGLDKKGTCQNVLFTLPNNEQNLTAIKSGMSDRMEQIEIKNLDMMLWILKQGRKKEETVSSAAFVILKKKTILFGFGRNWRQDGTIEEFLANPNMFIRTFSTMLDDEDIPTIMAIVDESPRKESAKQRTEPEKPVEKPEDKNGPEDVKKDESSSAPDKEEDEPWDVNIDDEFIDKAFELEEQELEFYE